jgi:ABC-2 type transport system ATP-binding protein
VTSSTPDALWSSRAVHLLRPSAVACQGLHRRGAGGPILDGLDLEVRVGARVLVVGVPDTTGAFLVRALAGLARLDSGRIRMAGLERRDDRWQGWGRRVAFVGSETGLYPWMSAAEALRMAADLVLLDPATARRRTAEQVERWGIGSGLDRPMRRLGLAYLQRVAMAAAMLCEPEVVLLEEPLRAVDPEERIHLLRLPGERRTVLIASRYPASDAGCVNQVLLVRGGRVAVHAPLSDLPDRRLPVSHRGIAALADSGRVNA